jgi:hypothetical protein
MLFEQRYVCATSSRFEVMREVQMPRWSRTHSIRQIGLLIQSKRVRPTTLVLALFFLISLDV